LQIRELHNLEDTNLSAFYSEKPLHCPSFIQGSSVYKWCGQL